MDTTGNTTTQPPAGLHPDGATRFTLLGPVRAWRSGVELAIGSRQQRTVLALLLLREGRLITTDELVDALWGEEPPRAAATTIRTYISRLRRILVSFSGADAPRITSLGGGYQLRTPPPTIDLWHFQEHAAAARHAARRGDYDTAALRLRSALDLDRGRPLTGASGPAIETQRDRLSNLLSAAAEEQLSVDIARGRHGEAIPELITLVARHPFREQLRELLILALYRCGRQAEALAQFQTARRVLGEELGIEPGPGLCRLQGRILTGDRDLLGNGGYREAPEPAARWSPSAAGDVHDLRLGEGEQTFLAVLDADPTPLASAVRNVR
ncbi:AfsR/SARP family transcriptional regulator [Actinoplanes sp. M2I2]|uniref:AfsR/SARP family transcriptional regulator n=1 Tax=Actinoplanes sp. M2I2 TaxID=1734444 RepID=UPI002021F111|nr:AfsR/SARP family transcriptional regulator [Actinoplanes sp. M2I2]